MARAPLYNAMTQEIHVVLNLSCNIEACKKL